MDKKREGKQLISAKKKPTPQPTSEGLTEEQIREELAYGLFVFVENCRGIVVTRQDWSECPDRPIFFYQADAFLKELRTLGHSSPQEVKDKVEEARKLEKSFKGFVRDVGIFLRQLDNTMKLPSDVERGKQIAELANRLEMSRDRMRYFFLGIDYKKDPEIKLGQRMMPK